jgi:hypothetical protein
MRNSSFVALTLRHGFGTRSTFLISFTPAAASRTLHHWLKRATDRAIRAGFRDLAFNPFLFVVESGR